MSPSSFPPTVPCPGAALCSTGSLGSVPPFRRSYCGAPTPRRPSHRASLPSLGGTAAILRTEATRAPRFLGNPPVHALLSDPGGTAAPDHRALSPTLVRSGVAFRGFHGVGSRDFVTLGAPSHGLHAPCLRFAAAVARGPRKTRFRLVVLLGRAGFEPAGLQREVSVMTYCYMASSSPRLLLAHGIADSGGNALAPFTERTGSNRTTGPLDHS
jgi:hypothetical protein